MMGLLKYLQSYVGRLLRPYLLHDASPLVELKLSGIHLHFPSLEFDVGILNSGLMSSSLLLLQRLQLEGARISFLPFNAAAFTLELGGIHVAMRLRSSEDGFWIEKKRGMIEQKKRDAILAIDPEGTAIHHGAEMSSKENISSGFWEKLFTVLALRTISVQIQVVLLELLSRPQGGQADSCCVTFRNVELNSGISEGNDTSGLLGASLAATWNALQMPEEPFIKVCKATGLTLHLKHKVFSEEQVVSPVAEASSTSDNNWISSLLSADDCVMTLEAIKLAVKLHCIQLDSLHFDVSQTTLRVDPQNLKNVFSIVYNLQCIGSLEPDAVHVASKEQGNMQHSSARTTKDLWQRTLERTMSAAQRKSLKRILQTGLLRRRYAHLYGLWLREIGWCPNNTQTDSCKAYKSQKEQQSRERIQSQLFVMEQDLPAEAIVLARHIARHRFSMTLQEKHKSIWKIDMFYCMLCLFFVRSFLCVSGNAQWFITFLFKSLYEVYYTMKWKLSYFLTKYIEKKRSENFDDFARNVASQGKQARYIFPKLPQWRKTDDTKISRSVRIRTGDVRGGKSKQAVNLSVIFWTGSINVTGSSHVGVNQSLLQFRCLDPGIGNGRNFHESTNLTKEQFDAQSLVRAICISWEEFYMGCHSNLNTLSLEVACGSLKGDIMYVHFGLPVKAYRNDQKLLKEDRGIINFLVSSPAPWVRYLKDDNKDSRNQEDGPAGLMWEKQQMNLWAEWIGCNMFEGEHISRPFLLADFTKCQDDQKSGPLTGRITTAALALGQLECSVASSLVSCMTILAKQFSSISSFRETPKQSNLYSTKMNNSRGSGGLKVRGFDSCMMYYLSRIRKLMLTMNKTLYVSAAIEFPKFHLSECVLNSVNDDVTGEMRNKSVCYEDLESTNLKPRLVLHLGLLKLVLWPYQLMREMLRVADPESVQQQPQLHDVEKMLLEESSGFGISEGLSSDSNTRDEVRKNIFLSLNDAALLLDFNSNETGTVALVEPVTLIFRSSVCRNSLSTTGDALSVTIILVVSAVTVHSYINEILPIFQILRSLMRELKGNPICSDLETASEDVNGKLIDCLHVTHDKCLPMDSAVSKISDGYISFSFKFQIRFESIHFFLSKQRGTKVTSDSVDDLMLPKTVVQDMNRAICISLQCFLLSFSWGDGHQLSLAIELQRIRICVLDYEKLPVREEETDSLPDIFELYKGISGDLYVGMSNTEERKGSTRVMPSDLVIEGCQFCFEGPYLDIEEDGLIVINSFNLAEKLVSSKAPCLLMPYSSRGSEEGKRNKAIGMTYHHPRIEGNEQAINYCVAADIKVDKILLADHILRTLIYNESSSALGQGCLVLHVGILEDFKGIAVNLKEGFIVTDARALILLLRVIDSYIQLLSTIMSNFSENEEIGFWNSTGHPESTQAVSVSRLPAVRRVSSFPRDCIHSPRVGHHRLYSAPTKVPLHQSTTHRFSWLMGHSCLNICGLTLIVAQSDAASEAAESLLFQINGVGSLEINADAYSASVDITHFSICSLCDDDLHHLSSIKRETDLSNLPKFGSLTSVITSEDDSNTNQRSLPVKSNGFDFMSMVDRQLLDGKISMFQGTDVRCGEKIIDSMNKSILEDLKVSCKLMTTSADSSMNMGEWKDSYYGTCIITGLDIAITFSEIQQLLALLATLSALLNHFQDSAVKALPNPEGALSQPTFTNQIEIPDGAVVVLKDANEHCYLAVEEEHASYRLTGVLHYSLVGERALFKVKYQDPDSRDPNKSCFFLLSVYAKNTDGKPFCIHFRPGSGMAVIGSVSDESWELWQTISYKHADKKEGHTFDSYENSIGSAVHLVNQKSRCALKFVNSVPMLVKQPGNPFKIKVLQLSHPSNSLPFYYPCAIPQLKLDVGTVVFTLLHAAGGSLHLLPLFQGRMENTNAVLQFGAHKMRVIGGTKISFDYFEIQSNVWAPIVHPIDYGFFYRCRRNAIIQLKDHHKKNRVLFSNFKKVDVVINELSLDTCLLSLGALDVVGSYSMRHSPILAICCHVENQTGAVLVCNFNSDHKNKVGRISPWHTDSFLVRHVISRRELKSALISSSVELHLETPNGFSLPVHVSLLQPAVVAMQTHFKTENGSKRSIGPIIVVETSEKNQDGIRVTVSPLVQIHNASGISLELRFYEPIHEEGDGPVFLLEDNKMIDDSSCSYDAVDVKGQLRDALASFNIGNYLLSIRPVSLPLLTFDQQECSEKSEHLIFDWSEDIREAKAVHASGIFEKLHYRFIKTLRPHKLESFFGIIHCSVRANEIEERSILSGKFDPHFLVRTTQRKVPLIRHMALERNQESRNSITTWHHQFDLIILPTIRMLNFLLSRISIIFISSGKGNHCETIRKSSKKFPIDQGGQQDMHVDLNDVSFIIEHHDLKLVSKPLCFSDWIGTLKQSALAASSGRIKELDLELDFEDRFHCARLKVFRGGDGVLQVIIYSQYVLHNANNLPLLCCTPKEAKSYRKKSQSKDVHSEFGQLLPCQSSICWLKRSRRIAFQRQDIESSLAELDLESFSGYTEISLSVSYADGLIDQLRLGLSLKLPSTGELDPTCVIHIVPRYMVMNDAAHAIAVCQDGFQGDENFIVTLNPGKHAALYPRLLSAPRRNNIRNPFANSSGRNSIPELSLRVCFQLKEDGCDWSGPVCAEALGAFSLRLKMVDDVLNNKKMFKYAAIRVEEHASSSVIHFSMQPGETAPYRLENRLQSTAVLFQQKDIMESEVLEPGTSVWYAWDNLCLPHKLVVQIAGTQLYREINLDKVKPWKPFHAVRHNPLSFLQFPFQSQSQSLGEYSSNGCSRKTEMLKVGFEILADGPQRVLCICEDNDSRKERWRRSYFLFPLAKTVFKIHLFSITLAEYGVQRSKVQDDHLINEKMTDAPIICMQISDILSEFIISERYSLFQLRVQTFNIDEKWHGAPFAAMLRVHNPDWFNKEDPVLQMAVVISNHVSNPNQVKYASILLQAVDLNMDEDTLMKLAPFYRHSLTESESQSRQIYFDRFEIHPIKIVVSFLPGQRHVDYTSTQEALRSLLHTVIKIPSIRGTTVELNGILLSHALLTFRQLAVKCVQHYSWYAMRAVYIAKGSKLLPPAFTSLFDDSAASSLDVFFDPSNGLLDLHGLTLGMYSFLNKNLRKRGYGDSRRYIGNLENAMRTAGSNIMFAVLKEVSDSMLKGAEAAGFDGMITGFRRGVLTIAMEPSLIRSAIAKGGSSQRIKLDRSAGVNEMYIEGYLQAMLDTLFKQDYLRVKVVDDEVFLRNLPPNSALLDEMVGCVKSFLVNEGLLAGETSTSVMRSFHRLQGETERQIGPTAIALFQQLFVIFAIRTLRNQTRNWLHLDKHDRKDKRRTSSSNHSDVNTHGSPMVDAQEPTNNVKRKKSFKGAVLNFLTSTTVAYIDGWLCRHIPNALARQIVSGFLLSFIE